MAKIAMLLPNEEMFRQAHDALQELRERVEIIKIIETEHSVTEARQAIRQGAEIIIARGLQATIIKQYTDIPVVEITLTPQGVRDMLERARRILGKENPDIAFVMFKNMSCDMADMDEKMHVHVREYYVQNPELLRDAAVQAVEDRADLIIGGATALEVADAAGIPSLFLMNTEDAIVEALKEALQLSKRFERGSRHLPKSKKKTDPAFVHFPYQSGKMEAAVQLAKALARTDCPKLIVEPVGTLYHAFVRAIHNASAHSKEKLLSYECIEGESDYEALFGARGIISANGKASIQITEIEYLDRRSQRKLLEMLLFRNIICVTKKKNLRDYLLPELFERLRPFAIEIPALVDTPEDLALLLRDYMMTLTEKYGKYHVLTKEAEGYLTKHCRWPGNRIQLESFLERLILTAEHRSISKHDAEALYGTLYEGEEFLLSQGNAGSPEAAAFAEDSGYGDIKAVKGRAKDGQPAPAEESYSEKRELVKALRESFGNREKTAEKLGISTTTLWRKLKKYNLL